MAVLHIFAVKGIVARFQRGGDNKTVIPGKAVPLLDIKSGIDGEPTNNGAARCALVEVCPSAQMTILVSINILPGIGIVPVKFISANVYLEAPKESFDFLGGFRC